LALNHSNIEEIRLFSKLCSILLGYFATINEMLYHYLKASSDFTSFKAISLSVGPSPNEGHNSEIGQAPQAGFLA
jgi:hypothetical protein